MFTMDDVNRKKQERIDSAQSGKAVDSMNDEEKRRTKIIAELALRRMELANERKESGQELDDPSVRPITRAELNDDELFAQIEAKQKEERLKKLAEKKNNKMLLNSMMKSGGNSKALPGQYNFREDPADDPTRRAIVHHTGSHYQGAHSRQFKMGNKVQGMVARHSHQASLRIEKSKAAMLKARDPSNGQTGSDNTAKTKSKKSKATGGARPGGTKGGGGEKKS